MRYSQAAASLLSTVLSFKANISVSADDADNNNIFISAIDPEADIGGLALTTNDKNEEGNNFGFKVHSQTKYKAAGTTPGAAINDARRGKFTPKKAQAQAAADIGILAAADISILAKAAPSKCTAGFVECKDGFLASDNTTTCFAQCAGKCCTGVYNDELYDSCYDFNGKVCKDESCNGLGACSFATIPSVVNSCKGDFACFDAGDDEGLTKRMVDSCNGLYACTYAAYKEGSIGDITGSCIGQGACVFIAGYHGSIGKMTNSCIGKNACGDAAGSSGFIRSISGSCIGDHSCDYFAFKKGTVGVISNACTNSYSCFDGASYGGSIKSITNSCTDIYSCTYLGKNASKVGDVKDSCKEFASCFSLSGDYGSFVGSVSTSCNADFACYSAGSGTAGAITSNLKKCCNAASACEYATQATLPAQCKNSKVRKCDAVSAKNSGWNAFNDSLLLAIHSLSSTKSLDILGGEAACAKLKPEAAVNICRMIFKGI